VTAVEWNKLEEDSQKRVHQESSALSKAFQILDWLKIRLSIKPVNRGIRRQTSSASLSLTAFLVKYLIVSCTGILCKRLSGILHDFIPLVAFGSIIPEQSNFQQLVESKKRQNCTCAFIPAEFPTSKQVDSDSTVAQLSYRIQPRSKSLRSGGILKETAHRDMEAVFSQEVERSGVVQID
jgi:hypothetical protein